MKKKILFIGVLLVLTIGCDSMMNTPTKRVEEFLNKYQRLDKEILLQLDNIIDDENSEFNSENFEEYKNVMKTQYKDLYYTIKEEMIDGDNATVTVEVEVYDYKTAIKEAEDFYTANPNEFKTEDGKLDNNKYVNYKIEKMKKAKDRIKYTLNLTLSRKDKKWVMNNITDTDREKIHGLYNN